MFTTILELAISMAFFFLMFSAICSAVQELIANALRWRAKNLEQGIAKLVQDPDLAKQLYNHPIISGLNSPRWLRQGEHKPSYIPPAHFASALIDVLKISPPATGATGLNFSPGSEVKVKDKTKDLLNSLVPGTGATLDDTRKAVENWFDESMNRVSGWYKRKAHAWMWLIGGVVCLLLNADSINVAKLFWNDEALRAATVKAATERVQQGATSTPSTQDPREAAKKTWDELSTVRNKLTGLNLPIGWCHEKGGVLNCWPMEPKNDRSADKNGLDDLRLCPSGWDLVTKLIGILLTVLAISQGAPFWFDAMQKIVNLRLAGEAPGEKKK
jgi:hypothetical protein